jgi:hypothetical protein
MVKEYIEYFRTLAQEHKKINGFCMMDAESAVVAVGEGAMQYPCLMLETLSGKYVDGHRDNPLNVASVGFIILDRCEMVNDFEREAEILEATFAIGAEVVAKVNSDVYHRRPLAMAAFLDFNPGDVKWQQEGPLLDNAFGTLFTFSVTRPANLRVDAQAWQG